MSSIRININGYELSGHEGDTILSVAKSAGIEIPTLCHDDMLDTYGACGLCVVEEQGSPRLLRACSTAIAPGMIINTNSERVLASRKTTIELLLSDHSGDCRPPCARACPADTDCQGYVGLIANGEFSAAYELIREALPLPASIGRVCPHPCEAECRRRHVEQPVAILDLKRFAADYALNAANEYSPSKETGKATGKHVSVIGGGPGGLSAAYFLRKYGHDVTVYDAQPHMGGMLRYGIPEYRLPKEVLSAEIAAVKSLGIKLKNNIKVGRDISFDYIRKNSDAVIVAIGCQSSVALGCPGEELPGVMGGVEFLGETARGRRDSIMKRVAVIGGGNTAMDACRTAIRFGAVVYNVYRRTRDEMPAEVIEISEAEEEGVIFKHLCNPIEIISCNGRTVGIRLQKMELGEAGSDGRRSPVPIPGAEETIDVDMVIVAIGQSVDSSGFEGLELTHKGTIRADLATYQTNLEGVFAIGDAANKGAGIAVEAIGDAKRAANVVDSYLNGKITAFREPFIVTQPDDAKQYDAIRREKRITMPQLSLMHRKSSFSEYNKGFTPDQAVTEALRCLECGCTDYFECKLLKNSRELNIQKADTEKYEGKKNNRGIDDSNPLLFINHDKCILCGQCVRVCSEVMNVTALGLISRGFEAAVSPAMTLPLAETDCISCGACASLCPTGAFGEKLAIRKPVPLKEKTTDTICSYCSLGCEITVATNSGLILRCMPANNSGLPLCAGGRFALTGLNKFTRITTPFIKNNDKQFITSYTNAYTEVTRNLQSIAGIYGIDSIAVTVSDKLTNEDIYLIKEYAKKTLEISNIYSVNNNTSGLRNVLGYDSSTNTMDELDFADVIILIAPDMINSHTIASVKIKRAVKNGAKLILISGSKTREDEYAHIKIDINENNSEDLLRQFAKLLYEAKKEQAGFSAYHEEFNNYLQEAVAGYCPGLDEAVMLYGKAKNAMIVYDADWQSPSCETLIADISVMSGHIGKPRNGIVALKRNNNSQGLADMGVKLGGGRLANDISEGKIKALLVFGEDIPHFELDKLEFLLACDSIMTETTIKANITLPLTTPAESNGTYTNTERKIRKVNASFPPVFGKSNLDIICGLANNTQKELCYSDYEEVFADIRRNIKGYENAKPGSFTYDKPILCADMSLTPKVPDKEAVHYKIKNTNASYRKFVELIRE